MSAEEKRRKDREYRAAKRAAMTPEERTAARVNYDRTYRAAHGDELRAKNRERWHRWYPEHREEYLDRQGRRRQGS